MSTVTVEVVYAQAGKQILRRVVLPGGSTAEDAVTASGLAAKFREAGARCLGIYGKAVAAGTVVKDGDRVEIYRRLRADPKDLRRMRAAKNRTKA